MAKKKKTGRDPAAQKLPDRILADTHPALSKELIGRHGYNSGNISPGSARKFDWNCPVCKERIKNVAVNMRARAIDEGCESRGCYICAEREPSGERGLPEPLDEELRGECVDEPGLTPKDRLMSNTPELRLWHCRHCDYEWRARVPARTSKQNPQGCPQETCEVQERVDLRERQYNFCLSMFVKNWQNTGYIELMGKLPRKHRVYWECELGHMRYATVEEVVKRHGCLTCFAEENRGKPLSHRDFKHLHGEFVGVVGLPTFGLQDVPSGSNTRVVIWQCSHSEHHRWKATPVRRTRDDQGCPYCAGKRVALPESLARTHRDIALEWNFERNLHPKTKRAITPDEVLPSDTRPRDWLCPFAHEYQASCRERTQKGQGCKVCDILPRCLARTHPELMREWHGKKNEKLKLDPYGVTAGSMKRVWWKCKQRHSWDAVIFRRAVEGHGCPFCAGKKTARSTSLLAVHPELIEHWHPTLNKMPTNKAPAGGDRKYWWQCQTCPVAYERVVRSMSKHGPGCKACRRQSRS